MTPVPHPFLDHDGPVVMAHRGFSHGGPENSMAAFAAAVELGVGYLETDVHATADGVPVAFHDAHLDRLTDASGRIAALPWDRVRRARIAGVEPIPRLEDVLGAWPQVRVNIDVKSPTAIGPLAAVLHRTRSVARVCVASFSDRRRAAVVHRLRHGAPVAWSPGLRRVAALVAATAGGSPMGVRAALGGAACVQVPESFGVTTVVTRRFVDAVHAAGVPVHVWTVNDPARMTRLLDLGVDGIVTDRADLMLAILRDRAPGLP